MKSCPSWSNILVSGKASLDHTSREAAEVADKDGGESGEETETRPPSPAAAGICVSGGLSWRGEAERQLQAHHGPVPAALPVAQPENISHRGQQIHEFNGLGWISATSRWSDNWARGEQDTPQVYVHRVDVANPNDNKFIVSKLCLICQLVYGVPGNVGRWNYSLVPLANLVRWCVPVASQTASFPQCSGHCSGSICFYIDAWTDPSTDKSKHHLMETGWKQSWLKMD